MASDASQDARRRGSSLIVDMDVDAVMDVTAARVAPRADCDDEGTRTRHEDSDGSDPQAADDDEDDDLLGDLSCALYLRNMDGLLDVTESTLSAVLLTHGGRRYTADMYEALRPLHGRNCRRVMERAGTVSNLSAMDAARITREKRLLHLRTIVRKLRRVALEALAVPVHDKCAVGAIVLSSKCGTPATSGTRAKISIRPRCAQKVSCGCRSWGAWRIGGKGGQLRGRRHHLCSPATQ